MRVLLVLLLAGCHSLLGIEEPDARCTTWTFTPNEVDPCAIPAGADDVVLTGTEVSYSLDGETGNLVFQDSTLVHELPRISLDGRSIVIVNRLEIELNASLAVTGVLPVVIVAWEDISIAGAVTAIDPEQRQLPPGADDASGVGVEVGPLRSGSGGGGFRTAGGDGGSSTNGPGGDGGVPRALPARLAGGCSGAPSADGSIAGGFGGGGIALIARTDLVITGSVGTPGGTALNSAETATGGNAGGGSGGMLELEAARIVLADTARVAATGGGGGISYFAGGTPSGESGEDATGPAGSGGGGGGSHGYIVYRAHEAAEISSGLLDSIPTPEPF